MKSSIFKGLAERLEEIRRSEGRDYQAPKPEAEPTGPKQTRGPGYDDTECPHNLWFPYLHDRDLSGVCRHCGAS